MWVTLFKTYPLTIFNNFRQNPSHRSHDCLSKLVGLGVSRTKVDSQRNPVYNLFHRIFVVGTKRFVSYTVNVILTRQTCGQRSSRAAESKLWALRNSFPEWICYIFPMSKCRGDWDLGLCTTSLAKREPLRNVKCRFFLGAKHVFFRNSPLRSSSLFASTEVVHRTRSCAPLHFDIRTI